MGSQPEFSGNQRTFGSSEVPDTDRDSLLSLSPWLWWRQQMPITAKWAYLDHAAVGPLSEGAARAISEFANQAACEGDTVWPEWAARTGKLRDQFAELLHCEAAEICMVPNTSTGINLVAEGWPWQPGDSIVVPEGEFPSNLFPWLNQESRGVNVRIVPRRDGQVRVEDLISHVDSTTRMIAVSWVGYASGFRIDIDSLVQEAHQRGVLVFLDAIQGLGVFPLDLQETPVDFLAADGHKWLLGPEGAGIAMIRREHLDRLRCVNVGWSSVKLSHDFSHSELRLRDDAARFEPGSANQVGIAGLLKSVEIFTTIRRVHGESSIGDRVISLTEQLAERLQEEGATTSLPTDINHRSGILTFNVPGIDPVELRREGLSRGVVLSCRGGGVRASIHAYNNEDDFGPLIETIRSLK
jgi:cysteine desulfurase / selenocysteine lyase